MSKFYLEDGVHSCDGGFSYCASRLGRIRFDDLSTE